VSELFGNLAAWIDMIMTRMGYIGIVIVMALENVFPPIPSELVMPLAGFKASRGDFNIFGVIIAGMIGSVIGALILYYLGAWANETIVRRFVRRWGKYAFISEDDLDVTLRYFSKYGEAVIFFGRLIPLVRSLISIPAGMNRMPMPKFLFYTVLGTTVWSALLTFAGWVLGENYELVAGWVEQYQSVVLAAIALGVGIFVYLRVIKPLVNRQVAKSK
jgi:membrane protein DedA with SNARE-associated domain